MLLDEQINSLSLHSPISGVVYQRRLKERLETRPVQRGQQLMEIVNTAGDWQLELHRKIVGPALAPVRMCSEAIAGDPARPSEFDQALKLRSCQRSDAVSQPWPSP